VKTIGLIGGMSWESSAVYYRLLNEMARDRLGGHHSAPVLLLSLDFAAIEALQRAGDWGRLGAEMAQAAKRLEAGGAEVIGLATNTMHAVIDAVDRAVALPLVHIADATAAALRRAGARRPLLLATRYTMEGVFMRERLASHGIEASVPDAAGRALVHAVIYDELCRGTVSDASRARLVEIAAAGAASGADTLILGCTELTLLLGQGDVPLPLFDTTRLHAEALLAHALGEAAPLYRPRGEAMARPDTVPGAETEAYLVPEQDQ